LHARRDFGRDYDRIVYAEDGLPTRAAYGAFVTKWSSRYPAVAWSREEVEEQLAGVSDGDTITILVAERPIKVRLAAVDTPERGQPWATRAKQALSDKVFRKQVEVRVVDTDRYGRTVGHVWQGDRRINREMVRVGHAWVYRKYLEDESLLDDGVGAEAVGAELARPRAGSTPRAQVPR